MRLWQMVPVAAACIVLAVAGCKRASNSAAGTTSTPERKVQAASNPAAGTTSTPERKVQAASMPAGWKVYTPPEGDFSVAVPADPSVARKSDEKTQKIRFYQFLKGNAKLSVMLFSERAVGGKWGDKPEEIRADPEVVAGSICDISSLGDMRGLEYRSQAPESGEWVFRTYRSPDGSRSVALRVNKTQAISDAEVRMFLESFKLLR